MQVMEDMLEYRLQDGDSSRSDRARPQDENTSVEDPTGLVDVVLDDVRTLRLYAS